MDQTSNVVNRVEVSSTFAAQEESSRKLCIIGGLSLYDTAIAYLIETKSKHRVVVFADAEQALGELEKVSVDLVLLTFDLDKASESQVSDITVLLGKLAPRPVLLISNGMHFDVLQNLLRHGVAGVILKTAPCETLLEAIDSASRGTVWLQREMLAETFSETSHRGRRFCSESARIALLTHREREIVGIACSGVSNRQIAERLQISEATVRHHLTSIFSKVNVTNRGELIVYAYRHRLAEGEAAEC